MIKESCNNMFNFSKEKGGEISFSIGAYMCDFFKEVSFSQRFDEKGNMGGIFYKLQHSKLLLGNDIFSVP